MKESFPREAVGIEDKTQSQWSHRIGIQDHRVSGSVLYAPELHLRGRNISMTFFMAS